MRILAQAMNIINVNNTTIKDKLIVLAADIIKLKIIMGNSGIFIILKEHISKLIRK
nr:hypothetical protein SUGSMm_36190 [Morganella morganii subsp. sibonii]